jgi:hypothetical protein
VRFLARVGFLLAFANAAALPGLSAQQVMRGQVLAGSQPVPNQPVSLHRVTETGGSTLATDTTDAIGNFQLTFDGSESGVRFVATRYEGKLYIGDTFREGAPTEYLLRVGPGATPIELGAGAQANTPAAPPAPSNRAGIFVLIVSGVMLSGVFLLAARQRGSPARKLLVEIADLDNRHDESPVNGYAQERAELLRRLRESA